MREKEIQGFLLLLVDKVQAQSRWGIRLGQRGSLFYAVEHTSFVIIEAYTHIGSGTCFHWLCHVHFACQPVGGKCEQIDMSFQPIVVK